MWWINQWFEKDWQSVEISDCKVFLHCSVYWRIREPRWDEARRTSRFIRGSWDEAEAEEIRKGEGDWISTASKIHQEIWRKKGKIDKESY